MKLGILIGILFLKLIMSRHDRVKEEEGRREREREPERERERERERAPEERKRGI